MEVHLVDGTYELFRHFFAVPAHRNAQGEEVGAVRGVVSSILNMVREGATHIGVATDHVIESFRNQLYPGYKTGAGVDPELLSQFPILEDALKALGVVVWPMIEFEADDALASAATLSAFDSRVKRVLICTPDKDLAQCVRGNHIVQLNRRARAIVDEDAVVAKFGVRPESIPDYLALVGDSADGYPGIKGWGAKKSSTVLARYLHLENIPEDCKTWDAKVPGAETLSCSLRDHREQAFLFRTLATLRTDLSLFRSVDELEWQGPTADFPAIAARLDAGNIKVPQANRK